MGSHLLCMNFAWLEVATMTISIGSKPSSGKGSQRNTVERSKYGTCLKGSHYGPFGLSVMTKCSTADNDIYLRSSNAFGMNSLSMPRQHETG
jgi:hypothetical protein